MVPLPETIRRFADPVLDRVGFVQVVRDDRTKTSKRILRLKSHTIDNKAACVGDMRMLVSDPLAPYNPLIMAPS